MELTFASGKKNNQIVFFPQGDLDLYVSVYFCNTVLSRFNQTTNHLVLDLSGVRYIDSSGVGALIRLAQRCKVIGGELQLANVTGTPRKVLEMSNVLQLFILSPSVEDALLVWE